jgi:RNA ligase
MFSGPYSVQAKVDGSLGILYWNSNVNGYCLATMGSFESEQAIRGTDILDRVYNFNEYVLNYTSMMNEDYTYLFEIIYPENRIVVDYGDCEQLVLLAVVDNKTGKEITINRYQADETNLYNIFPIVQQLDFLKAIYQDLHDLQSLDWKNQEGFVIHFLDNDIRVKIKFDNYLEMQKMMINLTPKVILEQLTVLGIQHVKDSIKELPENLRGDAEDICFSFLLHYRNLRVRAKALYDLAKTMNRKDFAIQFAKHSCQRIVFSMLDNKDEWFVDQQIWQIIEKWYKEGRIIMNH